MEPRVGGLSPLAHLQKPVHAFFRSEAVISAGKGWSLGSRTAFARRAWTNREIGERLFISQKTVGKHLGHIDGRFRGR